MCVYSAPACCPLPICKTNNRNFFKKQLNSYLMTNPRQKQGSYKGVIFGICSSTKTAMRHKHPAMPSFTLSRRLSESATSSFCVCLLLLARVHFYADLAVELSALSTSPMLAWASQAVIISHLVIIWQQGRASI